MRKRILLLLALALALCGGVVQAAPGNCTNDPSLWAFASEEIDVSSTAKGFTTTTAFPTGSLPAVMAVCTVEDDSIRFRTDGPVPTASVGTIIVATSTAPGTFTACGTGNLRRFRMIRVTTDADVTCTYYRQGDQ